MEKNEKALKHQEKVSAMHTLASPYDDIGEHEKARDLGEKAYSLRCEILGEHHPDTLWTLNYLAYSYKRLECLEKALELCNKVYRERKDILGESHPDTQKAKERFDELFLKLIWQRIPSTMAKQYFLRYSTQHNRTEERNNEPSIHH